MKVDLDKQVCGWEQNPIKKTQIAVDLQQETIEESQDGDKTINQIAFHPTINRSVEEINSSPKDKEIEMCEKKDEILKKGQLDLLKSDLSCSICSEVFIKPVRLPCMHTFCKTCILQWEKNKKDCPFCRSKYKKAALEDTILASCIKQLIGSSYTDDEKKQRNELVKSRTDLEKELLPPTFEIAQRNGLTGMNSGSQDREQRNIDFSYSEQHERNILELLTISRELRNQVNTTLEILSMRIPD